MLSLIARCPRTSCSRSARRPARTTSEKSRRSFSQDHFGSKVSRFERSQASGDESSSLSSFSVARRGVGLDGAGGTHADERRATTTMTRTRRIMMQALQEIEAISPILERATAAVAASRLPRAMDVPAELRVQATQPAVDLGLNWGLCKWWRHDFKMSSAASGGPRPSLHAPDRAATSSQRYAAS